MMDELTLALIARRAPTTAVVVTYAKDANCVPTGPIGTMCASCAHKLKHDGNRNRYYATRLATQAEARRTHGDRPCVPCRKHFTFLTDEQLGELSSCATSS